ncbi:MAG TPA: LuxR C-terminal-related transcriptional regulator [Syntrophales bacterium]|nr:LuxR C-terminal-related transcriptional regulator [Syntrophales bacterium]HPI58267.1 LuxR C-terminal-related transcriptional regulator [Syntrophales bacterium]HPN26085.1 LuxR C-terminal-related transcriptional regulator [Syntrophales bacterium]HQM30461.1 LuxR C-terminal-related transcriptional regulator [Syntrophales bacterium]
MDKPRTRKGFWPMPMDDSEDKHIFIVGPMRFQNFALAYYLKETLGVECTELTLESGPALPEEAKGKNSVLFLIDGIDGNLDEKISFLDTAIRNVIDDFHICLFNIRPDQEMAEATLNQQVQGIFYIDDDIRNLGRGLKAIFNGELWMPRRVLTGLIQNHATRWNGGEVDPDILTPREIEILYLLVTGKERSAIGDALFISPHTVRTHLSNIFRKIRVKNRLEAKVWFEKNREALRHETKRKFRIQVRNGD